MGTMLDLIEYWLGVTLPKAVNDVQGTNRWFHLGNLNGIPVCIKLQWEDGYDEASNPFVQDGYGLTAGLFEEYSALFAWDWRRLTDTCSLGPDQVQTLMVASWLSSQYKELERKAEYERRHGKSS